MIKKVLPSDFLNKKNAGSHLRLPAAFYQYCAENQGRPRLLPGPDPGAIETCDFRHIFHAGVTMHRNSPPVKKKYQFY